jgi:hypothetical protein
MTTVAEYHERTKHSPASVRANAHGSIGDQPLPFKIYENVPTLPLPRELGTSTMPALTALAATGGGTSRSPTCAN